MPTGRSTRAIGHGTHVAGIAAGNCRHQRRAAASAVRGRAARVHRQLQGADRPDRRGRRARRQLARDRGRDRGRGRRRDGRDQPLDRRARDRAVARHRRARARRGRRCGRRSGRRRRERLRRVRRGSVCVARHLGEGDHRRRRRRRARAAPRSIASFSSAGPTPLSLRLKPDVIGSGRRRSSRPSPAGGRHSPGRAWRRPTSPAPPRSSASGIRAGPSAQVKAALDRHRIDGVLCRRRSRPRRRASGGGRRRPRRRRTSRSCSRLRARSPSASRAGRRPQAPGRADRRRRRRGRLDGGRRAVEQAPERRARRSRVGHGAGHAPCERHVPAAGTADGEVQRFDRAHARQRDRTAQSRSGSASRRPRSRRARPTPLTRPGVYRGNTRGQARARLDVPLSGRPAGSAVTATLAGPEQVFRVTARAAGRELRRRRHRDARAASRVEPRDRRRGRREPAGGLRRASLNLNPYLAQFGERVLASGAVRPRAGRLRRRLRQPHRRRRGRVPLPLLVDDTHAADRAVLERARSAVVHLCSSPSPTRARASTLSTLSVDGRRHASRRRRGARGSSAIPTTGLAPGRHRLRVQVSDYQESRNMENVPAILPNTRVLRRPSPSADVRRRRWLSAGRRSSRAPRSSGARRGRGGRSRRTRRARRSGSMTRSCAFCLARSRAAGALRAARPCTRGHSAAHDDDDREREQHDPGPAHARV